MGNALKVRQSIAPRQKGERSRLKVMQGPDIGMTFVILNPRVTLGRGEENDVVLTDLKSSRLHAELTLGPDGWSIRDLGSSNGILVNSKVTRNASLRAGDIVSLGETTFEFQTAEQETRLLIAPVRSQEELARAQESQGLQAKRVRQQISGNIPVAASTGQEDGSQKRIRILAIIAVGVGVWLFMNDEKAARVNRREGKTPVDETRSRDLASMLPQTPNTELSRRADEFFQAGFREYLAGNYLRARQQFETVLQIYPSHDMAIRYVENCRIEMERTAKEYLVRGRNAMEGGKLKAAENQFEAVLRLYHTNQTNEHYLTAKAQLEELRKKIEKGGSS